MPAVLGSFNLNPVCGFRNHDHSDQRPHVTIRILFKQATSFWAVSLSYCRWNPASYPNPGVPGIRLHFPLAAQPMFQHQPRSPHSERHHYMLMADSEVTGFRRYDTALVWCVCHC